MKKHYEFYKNKLDEQKKNFNFRSLRPLEISSKYILQDGKKLLNLSSNDYLGISTRKDIRDEFLKTYDLPISVPSARLLCANTTSYDKLENFLCDKFSKEACLLFNSGYHANVGIYSTLAKKGDVVFCDKLNHASIISGLKLSQGDHFRYKHLDYDNLEKQLSEKRKNYKNCHIFNNFDPDRNLSFVSRQT